MPDWSRIISRVVISTGWTWDYCEDELTWPRIEALYDEWADHPPVHEMVAVYLGYKPQSKKTKKYGDLAELIGMFPTGRIAF